MKRLGLLSSILLSSYVAASPPVQVELRSSWSTPSFLLQIIEAFHAEEPDSFFPFLHALTNPEWFPPAESSTDAEVYKFVVNAAIAEGYLSDPGELASLDMSLALHTPLPKLEAAYRYYADAHPGRVECAGQSWVDWYGEAVCDAATLRRLVQGELIDAPRGPDSASNRTLPHPKLLPFDHISPAPESVLERPAHTAILYASLPSDNFRELHEYLYQASSEPTPVQYVLRHLPPAGFPDVESEDVFLSGYGVALDLKKMDYLALDDRRQGSDDTDSESLDSAESIYDSDAVLSLIHQYPESNATGPATPLAPEEILNVGLQAAQLLYDAGTEDALQALKLLTQNFPRYTLDLARRVTVTEALEEEIANNQVKAQGGISMVWLNGVVLPETDWNPFSLLRLLRKERGVMRSVASLGLNSKQAIELLTHRAVGLAQADTGVLDGLFDASDRPEGGDTVVWLNDFETDSRYERWGSALQLLLRPMYPGQLPTIKLNLFNIVVVADLAQASTLNFLGGMAINVIERGFGYRWGIVPAVETENGVKMARLLYWIGKYMGRPSLTKYITRIAQLNIPVQLIPPQIDWALARVEFSDIVAEYLAGDVVPEDFPADVSFDAVIAGDFENGEELVNSARSYAERLSADLASAPQGHVFVNGKHFVLGDDFLRYMQTESSQQLQHLQEQLYLNILTPDDAPRISTYFYDRPEASRRRNKHIYPSNKPGSLRVFSMTDLLAHSNYPYSADSFVYPPIPEDVEDQQKVQLTTFVVADLDSESGLEFVKEALTSLTDGGITRVSFVHNPKEASKGADESQPVKVSSVLGSLVTKGLLRRVPASQLLAVLGQGSLPAGGADQTVLSADESLKDVFNEELVDQIAYQQFTRASKFVVRKLKLDGGDQAIIMNGRVVGPIAPGEFIAEDFNILAAYEHRKRVGPVAESLEDVLGSFDAYDETAFTELITLASSIISSIHLPDPSEAGLFNAPIRPRRRNYQLLDGDYTKFEYGDNSTALFHFGVLLDPLSEAAQKLSSLLEWLLDDPAIFVELHINPPKYKELPLKRFYRYNLSPMSFDEAGKELGTKVVFHGLPEEPIYTLAMDVPPSWLVRPREALFDLDNILLSGLSSHERTKGVQAVFSLDYLVIEGHARESQTYTPPRGLQLELVTRNSTPIADTLVVANLGYLQFRTTPGVFKLDIRRGRGREVFQMESVGGEGWDSPLVEDGGDEVTLMGFEGSTLYPRVKRLPGMEGVDVLASPSSPDESVLGKLKSTFSSLFSKHETSTELVEMANEQAEINIFTVASGLLYERFVSIMILSVMRNTNSTVKFWFIENFLSPSFLEFIPHFAEAYGFKYELVTYKWPSWLRAQKEKQRIIWAYKILFLDVLFPMNLKKVIFVDADQIVRADLKELVDLDLHGAPYGYTPMGDDNVEMEGFRFWKTGYWKDFLQNVPYHISALYVVDLVRFREMAAGDILRSQYQHLSADPGSLANLDQDLPNSLQREVPIFSLPEDWLWCETWCSQDRLHRAKTIDLCQNPLTKEPKLARAKHIPEWEEYDTEVARFTRELADKGVIRSGMSVADTNVLADVGSSKPTPLDDEDKQTREKEEVEKPNEDPEAVHKKDEL